MEPGRFVLRDGSGQRFATGVPEKSVVYRIYNAGPAKIEVRDGCSPSGAIGIDAGTTVDVAMLPGKDSYIDCKGDLASGWFDRVE